MVGRGARAFPSPTGVVGCGWNRWVAENGPPGGCSYVSRRRVAAAWGGHLIVWVGCRVSIGGVASTYDWLAGDRIRSDVVGPPEAGDIESAVGYVFGLFVRDSAINIHV